MSEACCDEAEAERPKLVTTGQGCGSDYGSKPVSGMSTIVTCQLQDSQKSSLSLNSYRIYLYV